MTEHEPLELSLPKRDIHLALDPLPEPEQFGASALPLLPVITDAIDEATFRSARARRIFAACRWAGIVAVTEMVEGYDAAMRVVQDGPQPFMPDDDDWVPEKMVPSVGIAINFIEGKHL